MFRESPGQDFHDRLFALAICIRYQIDHSFIFDVLGLLPVGANNPTCGVGRFPRGVEVCAHDLRHASPNFRNYPAAMLANGA